MHLGLTDRVRDFVRSESTLVVSALVALISMVAFPPTPEHLPSYLDAIDLRTIGLLLCLMIDVAGLTRAGALAAIRSRIAARASTMRTIALLLTLITFFSSMIVTNDVALISFVPLTLLLFRVAPPLPLILALVAQTIAANLGSMLTPIGNPQNLYLYSVFAMNPDYFFSAIAPFGVLGFLASLIPCLFISNEPLTVERFEEQPINRRLLIAYGALFAIALFCVAHVVTWQICFAVTLFGSLLMDRQVVRSIDYSLLATFICFFIFVGNIKHIDTLVRTLQNLLEGREIVVSALASQFISNVPAAIMLSGFTENAAALLVGTNIGGLGTPVASLASLITLRLYSRSHGAQTARYLKWFTIFNVAALAVLLSIALAMV